MAIKKDELLEIIQTKFPDADIVIDSLVDDDDHYQLLIKDDIFTGKSKLEQHRIVFDALDGLMDTKLHALSIKTKAKTKTYE